jgi:hypothetical protein
MDAAIEVQSVKWWCCHDVGKSKSFIIALLKTGTDYHSNSFLRINTYKLDITTVYKNDVYSESETHSSRVG